MPSVIERKLYDTFLLYSHVHCEETGNAGVLSMLLMQLAVLGPVAVHAGDAVPGGFYMAADYVKYTTPMATSLSLLAWSLTEHKEAYKATVSTSGYFVCVRIRCLRSALSIHNLRPHVLQSDKPSMVNRTTRTVQATRFTCPHHTCCCFNFA